MVELQCSRISHHRFTKEKLCHNNLLTFHNKILSSFVTGRAVAILGSKTFHIKSHSLLLDKLARHRHEMVCFMGRKILMGWGAMFLLRLAACHRWGPQGLMLWSTLCNTFPNDLDGRMENALIKSSDDTKLGAEEEGTSEGGDLTERPGKAGRGRTVWSLAKISADSCPWGDIKSPLQSGLCVDGEQPCWKGPWVGERLNMCQQWSCCSNERELR